MTWKVWSSLVAGTMSAILVVGCDQATRTSAIPNQVVAAKPITDFTPTAAPQPCNSIRLEPIGQFKHGGFATLASEIAAYDVASKRLFVANVESCAFDILDLSNPAAPSLVGRVSAKQHGDKPTSVTARHGMIAMSVVPQSKRNTGRVLFVDSVGAVLKVLEVGHEPDMLTFSPDGHWLLVANEGEPDPSYEFDPEGTVSLIDVSLGINNLTQQQVTTLDFHAFADRTKLDSSIRIFGKNATVEQDLEPEYIAVSKDSQTAWVVCQENNALAVIDLPQRRITKLAGLGFKNHSLARQGLDASDQDHQIRIRQWPLKGMYQPDAIQTYVVDGTHYLVTANEGDGRNYPGFSEEARVAELKLDPQVFPDAVTLQNHHNLGRLRTTKFLGDGDGNGLHEEIYAYGARSFSIWTADGQQVFDSGDQFERIIAERYPLNFNADNTENPIDSRSDKKGPEPEGVALGEIAGRMYAFIGIERMGGVMVYDVSQPRAPRFNSYVNTRQAGGSHTPAELGDLGPEGLLFISQQDSPAGVPLLVVCNEISGTTRIFRIDAHEHRMVTKGSN